MWLVWMTNSIFNLILTSYNLNSPRWLPFWTAQDMFYLEESNLRLFVTSVTNHTDIIRSPLKVKISQRDERTIFPYQIILDLCWINCNVGNSTHNTQVEGSCMKCYGDWCHRNQSQTLTGSETWDLAGQTGCLFEFTVASNKKGTCTD